MLLSSSNVVVVVCSSDITTQLVVLPILLPPMGVPLRIRFPLEIDLLFLGTQSPVL